MRFRPRVWGEVSLGSEDSGKFRNPGDSYETCKPSYFVRWQVAFKF